MTSLRWTWPGVRNRASVTRLDDPPSPPDFDPIDADPSHASLTSLLDEIEASACAVYRRHDLPTAPGQYARSAKTGQWRYLSDSLTAEERWALVLAQKPGSGWRFASLPDLGDQTDGPADLRLASRVLRACHHLRARMKQDTPSDEALEMSIRLGADWLQLQSGSISSKPAAKKAARTRSKPKPKV